MLVLAKQQQFLVLAKFRTSCYNAFDASTSKRGKKHTKNIRTGCDFVCFFFEKKIDQPFGLVTHLRSGA